MSDTIIFICTVLGTLIAVVTYKKTFHKSHKPELDYLIERYKIAKALNEKVLYKLEAYAAENEAYDELFMQGITFRKGINILIEAKQNIFNGSSDAAVANIYSLKDYGKHEENTLASIEAHITHLREIQTFFNLYFEPADKGLID